MLNSVFDVENKKSRLCSKIPCQKKESKNFLDKKEKQG